MSDDSRISIRTRREEFSLLRDKVLLIVGTTGVIGIAVSAITIGVKDAGLALAALTVFGGIMGAPAAFRADESRHDKSREE